jgi:hypothetical protein
MQTAPCVQYPATGIKADPRSLIDAIGCQVAGNGASPAGRRRAVAQAAPCWPAGTGADSHSTSRRGPAECLPPVDVHRTPAWPRPVRRPSGRHCPHVPVRAVGADMLDMHVKDAFACLPDRAKVDNLIDSWRPPPTGSTHICGRDCPVMTARSRRRLTASSCQRRPRVGLSADGRVGVPGSFRQRAFSPCTGKVPTLCRGCRPSPVDGGSVS